MGRIADSRRRASFFGPSPTANPGGVGEGHQLLTEVPFFFLRFRGRLTSWVNYPTERRQAMLHAMLGHDLAREHSADLLRQAEKTRRVPRSRRAIRMPISFKSLATFLNSVF